MREAYKRRRAIGSILVGVILVALVMFSTDNRQSHRLARSSQTRDGTNRRSKPLASEIVADEQDKDFVFADSYLAANCLAIPGPVFGRETRASTPL